MSNKTRYFVLTAGAILVVGLTTGLVASYMGGLPVAFSRAAGPEELQYIPADASVVAYANVRDVMDSAFRERFRKYEPDTQDRDEFQQKTGIIIDQDIHSVVAAVMPSSEAGVEWSPERGGVLVLARGRFEQSVLEKLAIDHGGTVEQYQGKKLLSHLEQNEPAMAVGFIDVDLVALGSYTAVKRAIDAGAGNNILSNTEMVRQINDLDGNNAWAVGHFDAIAQTAHLPSELQAHLPKIQWFSAAGHVNGGLSGVFKAEARDDESAQNMRDMLRGVLALAKMQAGDRPEFKAVVDSLVLSGDGRNVALSFTLPSELFDALEALANQHQQ